MAHESFEDEETADLLNRYFVSIKVDKEERPDVDGIYMAFCQAFTGSGGWPTSIFMTPEQKPFFAGTYFPKRSRGRMIGFQELLEAIHEKWENDREALLHQADELLAHLRQGDAKGTAPQNDLMESAVMIYRRVYDRKNGGFGAAPKFPAPHNLLFLMTFHERRGDEICLHMAEHTLMQMYRGGLFDHTLIEAAGSAIEDMFSPTDRAETRTTFKPMRIEKVAHRRADFRLFCDKTQVFPLHCTNKKAGSQ
jgi:uncharacterized protein YyaL (SSP411 family)